MSARNVGHTTVQAAYKLGVIPATRPTQDIKVRHLPTSILPQYRGTRVVNLRGNNQDYDVYIGRANQWRKLPASKWANPFKVGRDGTVAEVLAKYRAHVLARPELIAALPELVGKRLGCWCAPNDCHGDVLVELLKAHGLGQVPAQIRRFDRRAVSEAIEREMWRNFTAPLMLPAPRIAGLLPSGIKAAELPTPEVVEAPRLVPMVLDLTAALAWRDTATVQAREQAGKLVAMYEGRWDYRKPNIVVPKKQRLAA